MINGVPLSSEPKRTFKGLKSVRANLSALETEMVQRFIHLQCYTEGLRIQQVTSWRKVSPLRVEPKHEQTINCHCTEGESRPIPFKNGLSVRFGSDDSGTPNRPRAGRGESREGQ